MTHRTNFTTVFVSCLLACLAPYVRGEVKLWAESAGTMVLDDRPAGTATQITLSGCRNEFLAAQLALRADQPADEPLSFQWTALTGPGGKSIARENLTLFRAADIDVTHGQKVDPAKDPARARAPGKYPDALVPLLAPDGTNVANAIKPDPDKTLAFWLDVFIPAGTPAGEYTGKITLLSGAKELQSIAIKLKVYNVEIPADSTIPSLFNLRDHPHVKANIEAYVAEVLRHRIQPTNYHYLDNVARRGFGWDHLDKLNPDAKGYVNVYVSNTDLKNQEQLLATLKDVTEHLKARKLFGRAYMYMKDEPNAKEAEGIVAVGQAIMAALPEWKGKLLVTTAPRAELDKVITTYSCALKCYGDWYAQPPKDYPGRAAWDDRRANGQKLWFYVSNAQEWPFPTFDIQTRALGFEPRVYGWAFWYEKAEGHLYWDLMFQPQWTLNTRFPPGDGQLIYPGDFSLPGAPAWVLVKDLKAPVVSRRLKIQRQGLQEWELLKMAETKAGRPKVQAIADTVYKHLGERTWAPGAYDPKKPMWSYDESAWDKARQQVIALLLAPGQL